MALPAILGGLSLASSLFGGGNAGQQAAKYNKEASGDFNTGRNYEGDLGGIGSQYGSLASQNLGDFQSDNTAYRSALGGEENYLNTDTGTNAYNTAQIARATGGSTAAFQQARSNLAANAAQRGLSQSSVQAGGLAGIDSAQAATTANAENNQAQYDINRNAANKAALTNLTGGVANTDLSRGQGELGQEGSIDSGLGRTYFGLAQNEQNLGLQASGAQNSAIAGGAGMLGQGLYGILGGGGGGGSQGNSVGGSDPGLQAALQMIAASNGGATVTGL